MDLDKKIKKVLQKYEEPEKKIDVARKKQLDHRRRNRRLKPTYHKEVSNRTFRQKNKRIAQEAMLLDYNELDSLVEPVHVKTSGEWM